MNINIIVAYCKNYGIGIKNDLPWKIKSDILKFRKLTIGNKNNAIIMGKNTYLSLNCDGLKCRDNLILSTSLNIDKTISNKQNKKNSVKSFENIEIMEKYIKTKNYDELWIIGGSYIYDEAFKCFQTDENTDAQAPEYRESLSLRKSGRQRLP